MLFVAVGVGLVASFFLLALPETNRAAEHIRIHQQIQSVNSLSSVTISFSTNALASRQNQKQ